MNGRFHLTAMCALAVASAVCAVSASGAGVSLAYQFKPGAVSTYKVSIVTEVRTVKAISGSGFLTDMTQTNTQEITIEETVKRVDQTGNAEILVMFKAAKMGVNVKSGASREPQPPDTLKYLAGRFVMAHVTADGKVLAVESIGPLLAGVADTVKEAALMAVIEQTYTEDFFKELLQNLRPQLPLDPDKASDGWETVSDLPLPRTDYKLRVTTKSTLGKVEAGVARIIVRGSVKAMPADVDAPMNPAAPTVEVLGSGISGDASFSVEKGVLLSNQLVNELTMRTTMRLRPPSARGGEVRTDVRKQSRTTTMVKLVK